MDANGTVQCYDDYYYNIGVYVAFAITFCAVPVYFLLGVFGQTTLLIAFLKQQKKDKGYIFQILVVLSGLIVVTEHTLYEYSFYVWEGLFWTAQAKFTTCYACLWICCHVSIFLDSSCYSISLLLSSFMALDRFGALKKGVLYKNLKKTGYVATVIFSTAIGFSSSFYQALNTNPILAVGNYTSPTYVSNFSPFFFTTLNTVWGIYQNGVRVIALIILCFCNVGIPVLYYKKMLKNKQILSTEAEARRHRSGKLLVMLSITESSLATVAVAAEVAWFMTQAIFPKCYLNKVIIVSSIVDGIHMLTSVGNFYLMFIFNRDFRSMIFSSVSYLRRFAKNGSQVQSI